MTDPFVASMQVWIGMFMQRSMRHFLQYSRDSGLSMSQIGALFHVQREGSSAVSHLGDGLGVSSAAASQLLDRLEQQGLILRVEDPKDRRAKQITLTDKGRETLQAAIHARQGWLSELAEIMTASEKAQIVAALEILIARTGQLEI